MSHALITEYINKSGSYLNILIYKTGPMLPFHSKTEQSPRRHISSKLLLLTWQCLCNVSHGIHPFFRPFMFFFFYNCCSRSKILAFLHSIDAFSHVTRWRPVTRYTQLYVRHIIAFISYNNVETIRKQIIVINSFILSQCSPHTIANIYWILYYGYQISNNRAFLQRIY